ncbi:hypothetical protein BKA61DRAFT_59585 [Leptodontidium sp. MPI-SDFR-AT-0119]|nr:hypothetical protein BKA61DRAFT_59585 [Leptodontidium sp. MPI-SDFR-AT-0119]
MFLFQFTFSQKPKPWPAITTKQRIIPYAVSCLFTCLPCCSQATKQGRQKSRAFMHGLECGSSSSSPLSCCLFVHCFAPASASLDSSRLSHAANLALLAHFLHKPALADCGSAVQVLLSIPPRVSFLLCPGADAGALGTLSYRTEVQPMVETIFLLTD